jgi:energy-coupling factor transport system ATP-binding protein
MRMAEPALELSGFSYRYPGSAGPALREVDLRVEAGEMVLLSGRSGSGKSTLLRAACGLIPHFHGGDVAGAARVCGLDLSDHGPAELGHLVGMVAQEPETQVVSATVRAEIELPLEIRGESPPARARAVEEVALALGIERLLERPTASLSGGELQRVALAAALVGRPRLILLDEPTSQLDPVAGDELIGLLRRLNEEWGATVLLAEHRLERCLPAADRVIAFAEGRVRFDGPPEAFMESTIDADPALATPVATLFAGLGIRPVPVGVKQARRVLADRKLAPTGRTSLNPPHSADSGTFGGAGRADAVALKARRLWVELESGSGPRRVLRGISLDLRRGERVVLMGRNGAGKTTLMRTAAGVLRPTAGRIAAPGGIALAPQTPSEMIVRDRVADELPGEAGRAALDLVGLGGAVDSDPRDLSGGERQRLTLALAMAGRTGGAMPGLVCLDEPTRGMDAARKLALREWLGGLAAAGSAVLVATHDIEFAARFADRVLLLGEGELLADGPPGEVLAGGWYFATEVARVLDGAAVTPEAGIELLGPRGPAAADAKRSSPGGDP